MRRCLCGSPADKTVAVFLLQKKLVFPDPTLANKDGLLAVGGDLCPDRLLLAYRQGIFPWYSDGDPILWWSTDPRLVLYPREIKTSRSLIKILRQDRFTVSFDKDFGRVLRWCAQAGDRSRSGTWITTDMIAAYEQLHRLGYAHSVETWQSGELVGGLYGVSLGLCFFGESMFSQASNASKVALVALACQLRLWNFQLIDCQMSSDHLVRMGARLVPRHLFLSQLNDAMRPGYRAGSWSLQSCCDRTSQIPLPSDSAGENKIG